MRNVLTPYQHLYLHLTCLLGPPLVSPGPPVTYAKTFLFFDMPATHRSIVGYRHGNFTCTLVSCLACWQSVNSVQLSLPLHLCICNCCLSQLAADLYYNSLQALEVYPHSGQLLGMLAECEQRAHTLSRLRLHLQQLPRSLGS